MKKFKYIPVLFILTGFSLNVCSQTWYDKAEERIDQIRKRDYKVVVYDALGNEYTDSVKISLVKHEFPWGTVIPIQGSDDYVWGRAVATKYFNYGVTGNDFKWPWLEKTQGVTSYETINEVLDWVEKVDFGFRGHTLLWGGNKSWEMPSWTLDTSFTPAQVYAACETHIRRDVNYFKGRVDEYDVVNEPSAGHETWLAETVGDSINWNSFKWAHETDPVAKLYVNDYNIIVWGAAPEYHTLIKKMLDHGAPIDGIGVQGHMAGSIDWSDIKTKIDYMSDLGLPIRVTEFDMEIDANNVSEQTQANEYAEMMRTIFSHPSMNGFVFWSISDKDAWRDGSGIYTENRVPKIAADTVYHLIHEKWSTNLKMKANLQDTFKFRGFYGFYNVVVDYGNGVVKEFKIDATKAGGDSVFVLNYVEGSAVAPVLKQVAQSKDGRGVILTFDRAINPQTVKKEDFHLFMGDETTIDSLIKVSEDSTVFQICLKDTVKYRQFASLIYDGDTVATADGAQLPFFGPETIENKLPGFRFAETDTSGSEIVLGFSKEMNSTIPVSEFKIYVNGVSVSILSADYNTDGNIVFQLSGKVTWEDLITISYQKGTFTSTDEYILYSFGPKFVENNVSAPVNSTLSVDISKLILFPNPASNELNLSGLVSKSNVTIQLVNMEGKNLLSTYMKAEQTDVSMDIHSLLAGMYICRIMDDNGKVICLKEFVKQ